MSVLTPLATRRARRITVGLALAITALLSAETPASLHGFGILLVLALAVLDVLLVDATAGLAFTRARHLDERERALRDGAYRRGFRLLGVAVVAWLVIFYVTAVLPSALAPGSGPGSGSLATGISGRGLVAIVEILLMAPTMVIAWAAGGDRPAPARSSRRLWLAVPGLLAAWLAVVATAPVQAAGLSSNDFQGPPAGAACAHYAAGRVVGDQFGAIVGLRAEVCWNGHDAFVYGDPSIPLPQSEVDREKKASSANTPPWVVDQSDGNRPLPEESGCGGDNRDDFETVTGTRCTAVIDSVGTLHYSVHAQVSGPLGLGERTVSLSLVVDRTGRVLQRP